jgi:hypothetical protein
MESKEIIEKYIKKIKKIHKDLENDTNQTYEIHIYNPTTFQQIKIGDLYNRSSFIVSDALPKYKSLEGKYTSVQELKDKIISLYPNENINVFDNYIGLGKGAIKKIAIIIPI